MLVATNIALTLGIAAGLGLGAWYTSQVIADVRAAMLEFETLIDELRTVFVVAQ